MHVRVDKGNEALQTFICDKRKLQPISLLQERGVLYMYQRAEMAKPMSGKNGLIFDQAVKIKRLAVNFIRLMPLMDLQ